MEKRGITISWRSLEARETPTPLIAVNELTLIVSCSRYSDLASEQSVTCTKGQCALGPYVIGLINSACVGACLYYTLGLGDQPIHRAHDWSLHTPKQPLGRPSLSASVVSRHHLVWWALARQSGQRRRGLQINQWYYEFACHVPIYIMVFKSGQPVGTTAGLRWRSSSPVGVPSCQQVSHLRQVIFSL